MERFLDFLNENRWLNLIFLALTIISIVLTIFFYFKSKKKKTPTYLMKTFNLLKNKVSAIDKITIHYSKKPVKNLSVTMFSFWNHGNDVINYSDVSPKNPISLRTLNNTYILDARFLFLKNEANNFKFEISEDKEMVTIFFDYFYRNEGFKMEIYHTGTSGQDIELDGSLKHLPKIKSAEYNDSLVLDILFDNSIGLITNRINTKLRKYLIVPLFPFLIVLIMIGLPIQLFYGTFITTKIPKEYSFNSD
ncbi:hypothetical protein [Flagellimonas lutaonensis]|uniref:Uncharacterized protein n=1 Tax=Flagellimonas lutaonensis TaxID=516051 RepID=A0A0D5YWE9_9FLAO|nr:hypothetical protein [Allomuricauda lutaonensis]AKA36224.1 hypothetical protein VC82_2663 [Allomuricauda lutaonensis]